MFYYMYMYIRTTFEERKRERKRERSLHGNLKYNDKLMKFANKLANKNIENSSRTLLRCTNLAGSLKLNCVNRENFPVSFLSFSLSIFPLLSLSFPPLLRTTFNSSEFTATTRLMSAIVRSTLLLVEFPSKFEN